MYATKLPVSVEFYPCERVYFNSIADWSTKENPIVFDFERAELLITTLGVKVRVTNEDMIVKEKNGDVHAIGRDVFEKNYKF